MRRTTFAAVLVLLATLAAALPARAAERVLVAREGKGFLERIDGQPVLHVEGSPREMGLQHGKLLAREARESIRAYLHDFALGDRKHTMEELLSLWKKHLPHVSKAWVEELEGLADGAGIPRDEVFAAHVIPTIYHCSGAALSGKATKDGKLYHYRSLDYAIRLGKEKTVQENACLLVRKPEGKVAHVVVGWAGVVGAVTGMSAEGISLGEMGSGGDDEERGAGAPMMAHLLSVLAEARTGDDAVRMFREWKRGEGYNFIVSDGKTGKAWALEVTHTKFASFGMGDPAEDQPPHFKIESCVRRVNHFVSPELAATQRKVYDPRQDPGSVGSWLGYSLISQFIQKSYGQFDGEKMIALCRSYPPEHECLHQAVMCPTDGRLWVANAASPKAAGRLAGAQNQRFHAYDLGELLRTDPAKLAGGAAAAPGAGAVSGARMEGRAKGTKLDLSGVTDEGLRKDLAAFDGDGPAGEFDWTMKEVRSAGQGGAVYDVTFPTALPSGIEENDTVWCRYYAPQGVPAGARVPAAIVLHHLGGDFGIEAALADYLAKAGVAALQVEFPFYGPRRPKDKAKFNQGLLQSDFPAAVRATRQAVADVRRAADWLVARPDVDAERVGTVGISLGAIVGSLSSGVDPRFKRNVFLIGGGDLTSIVHNESRETRKVREVLKERGIDRATVEREVRAIEPLRYAARIHGAGTLMINARHDEIIPRACTERLWEAAGKPEIVWYESGHGTIAVYLMDLFQKTREHFQRPNGAEAAAPARPATGGGEVF